MLEKLPVYVAKSLKLSNIDLEHSEALSFLCQGLIDFGYWVPRGVLQPFHAIRILRRTVKAAKKRTISTYETPKLMTDLSHKAAMLFLSRIFYTSYFTGSKFLLVFSACQMVQMTLDHGVSTLSGQGYASLGMITNSVLGDFATSSFLAETALTIQEAVQSKYLTCQTILLSSSYILAWSKPLQSQLNLVRHGYSVGMRSGNVEYAFWCQHRASYVYPYIMGKPLKSIDTECAKYVPQMEELQQNTHALAMRSCWQLALNLMGEAENDLLLHGEALEEGQLNNKIAKTVHRFQTSDLYLFFGKYELAAKSALDRGEEFNATLNGNAVVMIETFHRAIALFIMARKTKSSKYSKPAHRIRKKIAGWVKSGNPNVKHYDTFLQAEHAALRGKKIQAKGKYEEAIKLAARTGHLHHAALFNERFADHLKRDLNDEEEASYRLKEAIRWYGEWGAKRKVELLIAAQGQKAE
ncbi:MAG: hypothetical protein SGBAC_013436 [Bacillariaceae sp.]